MTNTLTKLALDYSNKNNTDLLYIRSGIKNSMEFDLYNYLAPRTLKDNLILILVTEGGSPEAAYKMARILQGYYTNFDILLPGWCNSAGTIMSIGARKLYMTELSELGPIDLQIPRRDGTGSRISNLALRNGIDAMAQDADVIFEKLYDNLDQNYPRFTEETKCDIAQSMGQSFIRSIATQITPESLGENLRQYKQGYEYATRLNKRYGNAKAGTIIKLLKDYPSHSFVIDFYEASNLFNNVDLCEGALRDIIETLGTDLWTTGDDSYLFLLNEESQEDKDKTHKPSTNTHNFDGNNVTNSSDNQQEEASGDQTATQPTQTTQTQNQDKTRDDNDKTNTNSNDEK